MGRPSRYPVADAPPSYWQQEAGYSTPPHPTDSNQFLPSFCDVAIIGGGFSGIATAWHLLAENQPPLSVVLIEARDICDGATGRNGGNLRPDQLLAPARQCKQYGCDAAYEVMRFEVEHLELLRDLIEEEAIDCDFNETSSMLVLTTDDQIAVTREMYGTMQRKTPFYEATAGHVKMYVGDDTPARSGMIGAKGCVSMPAARLSPYKLLAALLKRCLGMGLVVRAQTAVKSIQAVEQGGYILHAGGEEMAASKVVFATNAYTSTLLPEYAGSIVPCKGLACHISGSNGQKLPALPTSSIVSMEQEADSGTTGYNYLIQLSDNTIVVGGAHHKYDNNNLNSWYDNADDGATIKEAEAYFRDDYMQKHFIGWQDSDAHVHSVWTGIMGYTADSLPHIGPVPQRPGSFVLAGFDGHGVPVIFKAAKEIAAMITRGLTYGQTSLPRLFETTTESLEAERCDIVGSRGIGERDKKR